MTKKLNHLMMLKVRPVPGGFFDFQIRLNSGRVIYESLSIFESEDEAQAVGVQYFEANYHLVLL